MLEPTTSSRTILDLNPHLDYASDRVPETVRDLSIGDPRGIVWNSTGTRGYVTGMGSHNLVVIDANGQRVGATPVELGEGASGVALDEARQRLYVLNRFSSTLSVLDLTTLNVVTNVAVFDPTPPAIRKGRKHLYDTRRNSGLGQAACGSCHVDARFDRLAWDLGDPRGITPAASEAGQFHPMKGPLVTQTLQDIINAPEISPSFLHWRGDRPEIESFNVTFTDLLARETPLTTHEMQEFKDLLSTIHFAPSRFRNFDNSLPTDMPLPGFFGLNTNGGASPTALPHGDAARGHERFFTENFDGRFMLTIGKCTTCHNRQSGGGIEGDIELFFREDERPFKAAQFRSIPDKMGFDLGSTNSRAGFGFRFDGRADTLTSFFSDIFRVTNNQIIADMTAFLLAFPGGMAPVGDLFGGDFPDDSLDCHAAVGRQFTLHTASSHPLLSYIITVASGDEPSLDLVVRGSKDGLSRSWHYTDNFFQSDRHHETETLAQLLELARPLTPLTFTVLPLGTGRRIGIDRDEDGFFDRAELDTGFDPADPQSHPPPMPTLSVALAHNSIVLYWPADSAGYRLYTSSSLAPPIQWQPFSAAIQETNGQFSARIAVEGTHFFQLQWP